MKTGLIGTNEALMTLRLFVLKIFNELLGACNVVLFVVLSFDQFRDRSLRLIIGILFIDIVFPVRD